MASLFQGRLLQQAARLEATASRPTIIVEGSLWTTAEELKNPNAVYGALATIVYEYGCRFFMAETRSFDRSQVPLFQRGNDAYEQVREWGYRLSKRFERLNGTQFQNLPGPDKEDFFVVAIKYRTALEKVPLILPGTGEVYDRYRRAEDAAKVLAQKIIRVGIYSRRDALQSVRDKAGSDIIQFINKSKDM